MPTARATTARSAVLGVPASQVALAASGYLVLVLAGRTTTAGVFTSVSAFYLLLNTVGRGVFAAVELELTRAVSAARAAGDPGRRTAVALGRRTLVLLAGAVVLIAGATPLLLVIVGGDPTIVGLLLAGAAVMAGSYFVRGPLAALGAYRAYAATFFLEAACCAVGGIVLALTGTGLAVAWSALFVLAPLVGSGVVAAVVLRGPRRQRLVADLRAGRSGVAGGVTTSGLVWSSVLFLSSQGVWNLAAVVVAARSVATPEIAAGFAAVSILLRAPVLVFPALQALLLPAAAAEAERGGRSRLAAVVRRRSGLVLLASVVWLAGAIVVVPVVTRVLFGIPTLPSTAVVVSLASASLLGAGTQLLQTQLVAEQRHARVAVAWVAGLALLVGVAFVPLAPPTAGALAQVVAILATGGMLVGGLRRRAPP